MICRLRATRDDFGSFHSRNLLGFEPCQLRCHGIKYIPNGPQKQKPTKMVGLCFWWGTACTNRAENKQEFSDLMKRVKEFKDKHIISPDGEN